jgi:hypothetical protein
MGEYEDMARISEAVDQLGDQPPTPEDLKKMDEAAKAVAESDDYSVAENLSGGLSERLEEDDAGPLDVDDLFGLLGDEPKPAQKAEPEEESNSEESTAPETGQENVVEEPSGVDARIKELSERLRRAEEQNDLLIKRQLGGDVEEGEERAEMPELEPDVQEYLRPYVDSMVKKELEEMREYLKPVRDQQEREAVANRVKSYPGLEAFKPEHVTVLEQAFASLPEEEKPLYQGGGMAGAILLAQRLASEGKLGLPKKSNKPSGMASRHHSESSGASVTAPDTVTEDDRARRIMNMSGDQVLEILERGGFD